MEPITTVLGKVDNPHGDLMAQTPMHRELRRTHSEVRTLRAKLGEHLLAYGVGKAEAEPEPEALPPPPPPDSEEFEKEFEEEPDRVLRGQAALLRERVAWRLSPDLLPLRRALGLTDTQHALALAHAALDVAAVDRLTPATAPLLEIVAEALRATGPEAAAALSDPEHAALLALCAAASMLVEPRVRRDFLQLALESGERPQCQRLLQALMEVGTLAELVRNGPPPAAEPSCWCRLVLPPTPSA